MIKVSLNIPSKGNCIIKVESCLLKCFFVLLIRTLYQVNLDYRQLSLGSHSSPYNSLMSVKSRLKNLSTIRINNFVAKWSKLGIATCITRNPSHIILASPMQDRLHEILLFFKYLSF